MFKFNIDTDKHKHVHFIGIGGVSMSALAEYLLEQGYTVSGSDAKKSMITEKLSGLGATIYYGHSKDNIGDSDLVIYTDAISMDNEELKYAIREKVDLVDRAEFLGQLMLNFKFSIAISGTHGKTSTTSMITEIIYNDKSDPTIMLGGNLDKINGNIKIGKREVFLTEACEYKGNIEKYFPKLAVIMNIDVDHLDYFDNIDHIIRTFENYTNNLSEDSYLIYCSDDKNSESLKYNTKAHVITFGIDNPSDFSAKNIRMDSAGYPSFDVYHKHKKLTDVSLKVLGKHNIYNALAAITTAYIYGIDIDIIKERISNYTGVHRRLEYKGSFNDVDVFDDYAHHPTEIQLTLAAIRNRYSSDIYCIFQPHTFTRTKKLLNNFSESFNDADKIIIADIYAAREKDYGDIHSKMLVDAINEKGKTAIYLGSFEEIKDYILKNAKSGDCVITMGAGDIYQAGEMILEESKYKKIV